MRVGCYGPLFVSMNHVVFLEFWYEIWKNKSFECINPERVLVIMVVSDISYWENPPSPESGSMSNLLWKFGMGVNVVLVFMF